MEARARWLSFLGLFLTLLVPLAAQGDKFALAASFEPATAKPGDTVELVLSATVVEGWHAYGALEKTNNPVALKPDRLQLGGLELVGDAKVPPGEPKMQFGMQSFPLPNTFVVRQAMRVPAAATAGAVEVKGALDYQLCDENMCLRPDKKPFAAVLQVEAASADAGLGYVPGLRLEPDEKLTVAASLTPPTARAGELVTLVLDVTVIDGYHAYGSRETTNIPVTLPHDALQPGALEPIGAAEVPPGEPETQFGAEAFPLPHRFQVTQQLRVSPDATAGAIVVKGRLDYQLCDENSCDPPEQIGFEAELQVEAGAAREERLVPPQPVAPPGNAAAGSDNPFGGSWWALILACIGGGLFALAMPCTYPMIPITFSFFTKQAEKRGGKVLPLALVYGFGIIAMFVGVGVLLSAVIIDVVNHWLTNVVIGAMFFFFAFVLFGWINLNPPQFVQRAAGKASTTGGLLGVFFMGATLVITSFTCTAPIVGSLIANVAKFGTLRVGIGMAIFGLTMAIPFVALSLMPTKVKAMPKSGEWMETLKISLGFVELAAAFKFVSMVDFYFGWQVLPRELFLLLWTAIFLLWAGYLFGILRKAGTPNEGVGNGRMAGGMVVTLFATYFLFGALGFKVDFYLTNFIPGYSAQSVIARGGAAGEEGGGDHVLGEHLIVLDNQDKAVQLAKAEDKLLLYNFTGFN